VNDWCDEDMFLICATDIQTDMLIIRLYTPTRVYYSAPDRGVEYCDERVCLSVIMSSELHVRFSPTFLCMLPMAHGLVLLWQCSDMLCISGFMDEDDVTSAHKPRLLDRRRRRQAEAVRLTRSLGLGM